MDLTGLLAFIVSEFRLNCVSEHGCGSIDDELPAMQQASDWLFPTQHLLLSNGLLIF